MKPPFRVFETMASIGVIDAEGKRILHILRRQSAQDGGAEPPHWEITDEEMRIRAGKVAEALNAASDFQVAGDVELKAKNANAARREIAHRWPDKDVNYTGYDSRGEAVVMSLVRKHADRNFPVASAVRNRRDKRFPAVRFVAHVPII